MKRIKILFASGMNEGRSKQVLDEVRKQLIEKKICDPEFVYVNVLQNKDVSKSEQGCDFAISAGQHVKTNLKVVDGRNLVYSFLGTERVYREIEKVVKEL